MATMNKSTLLEMADNVSINVIQEAASEDGQKPSKSMIVKYLNDAQKRIFNRHKDWTFLNKTVTVENYTLEDTTSTFAIDNDVASTIQVANYQSGTAYVASPMTITVPTKITNAVVKVFKVVIGIGEYYGNMQMMLCPIIDGNPDTDNPIITSNLFNPYRPNTAGMDEPFTFSEDTAIPPGEYFMVLAIMPNAYNGIALKWGTTVAGNTLGKYKDVNGVWTSGDILGMDLVEYEGTFNDSIILPNDVQRIFQIYTGSTHQTEAVNTRNGYNLMSNRFRILRVDPTTGGIIVEVNSNLSNVMKYIVEYKSKGTMLVEDTDTSLIPSEYEELLEKSAELTCLSIGLGQSDKTRLEVLAGEIAEGISNMEMSHRDKLGDFGVDGDSIIVPYDGQDYKTSNANKMYPTKPNNKRWI